ncbi:MAG TPA: cadherin-like domain-containing protein [Vitreimonas sp.]|nr:cadherin-like domain-containing protein [Vitreimonas sp.]
MTVFATVALLVGMFVPVPSFAAAESWSLTRTPSAVTGGAPASVQLTATSLSDDGANKSIGCVIVRIPASAFTVTNVVIDSVSDGGNWSASFSGDGTWWYARLVSDGSGQSYLKASESVTASVTFTDTGADGTFTWTGYAYDKENCTGDFATPQTVSVTVDAPVSNNAPVAQPDSYSTGRNAVLVLDVPGVLVNDDDPDGDPLTALQTGSPANGVLLWAGDGSFTYTPDPGFVGTDSFTYQATDGITPSADVAVLIDVTNGAPVAVDDAYSVA